VQVLPSNKFLSAIVNLGYLSTPTWHAILIGNFKARRVPSERFIIKARSGALLVTLLLPIDILFLICWWTGHTVPRH